MQTQLLLKVMIISDDDTGVYQIGELDFGKIPHCEVYFEAHTDNRKKFVSWLRWLADAAEKGERPFKSLPNSPQTIAIPEETQWDNDDSIKSYASTMAEWSGNE